MIRTTIVAATICSAALCSVAGAQITTQLITNSVSAPTFMTTAPDGSGRLFVLQRNGQIRIIENGVLLTSPFLDIDSLIPNVSGQDERGLLGLAFHPNYVNNGKFYVDYINNSSDTVVAEYTVFPTQPNVANPTSGNIIFTLDQPFTNHNGGWLGFGPDGYLYISTGDGGSANDPGNRAQNLGVLLGKMLRVDVDGDDFPADANRDYAIPADNPFVGVGGAMEEIWAYGLRNPWRSSFDTATNDLWIADVGQNNIEEINFQPANDVGGENYGWRCYEGNNAFNTSGCPDMSTMTFPVHTYPHTLGRCSITGGYVYHGCAIPELEGMYIFGDFCGGQVYALDPSDNSVTQIFDIGSGISAFGQDDDGEIYVLALFANSLSKLVPTSFPDVNMDGIPDTCQTFGCNGADLGEPFGQLDFTDVTTFLVAFANMEPEADLAAPMGQWDFSDVTQFLVIFSGGCP
ncbi:MAG: PQQ-dependent sugar dehydrogenase [Phycisphaerales bacterium]